jgi:hypothetical protein
VSEADLNDPATRLALRLAARAFRSALRDDTAGVASAMEELSRECGGDGTCVAIIAFCDWCITAQGLPPAGGRVIRPKWLEAETGRIDTDAAAVPPRTRWAGQLITARAAMDHAAVEALISAIPADPPEACGQYVWTLLNICATTARHAGKGT